MVMSEKILQQQGAKKAFDRLVEDELDQGLLEYWLCSIASSLDTIRARPYNRRRAASLVKKTRKLATEIERESHSSSIPLTGRGSDIEGMLMLPKILRTYANFLETNLSMRVSGNVSPRTEQIDALLEIVKQMTGRYHYEEVADLLNAVDTASGRGEDGPLWDVTNLKQRQYLARKRLARVLEG